MERLQEIREFTQVLAAQHEDIANRKEAERIQARDQAWAVSKLIQLDSKELGTVEALDAATKRKDRIEELQNQIETYDIGYQRQRKKIATIMDKQAKFAALKECRDERNAYVNPLQDELNSLLFTPSNDNEGMEVRVPQRGAVFVRTGIGSDEPPPPALSPEEKKNMLKDIRHIYKSRKKRADPGEALLEIGQMYCNAGHFKKGEEYFLQAAEDPGGAGRQRAACFELYQLYYYKGDSIRVAKYMKKWLELARKKERQEALEMLEIELAQYESLRDPELRTKEEISTSALLKESLGSLADLRRQVLEELVQLNPTRPDLLQALASMYVRLHDYDKARHLLDRFVQCPQIHQLSLFTQVNL